MAYAFCAGAGTDIAFWPFVFSTNNKLWGVFKVNKKFGVVLSLLFVFVGSSAAIAASSDDEAQRAIDRIVEEGMDATMAPAIPVAEPAPAMPSDRIHYIDVQQHIDQVVEQGAAEAFAS